MKVYVKFQQRTWYPYCGKDSYVKVPVIVLAGKWLKEAGLGIDDPVIATVTNNRIVINKKEK